MAVSQENGDTVSKTGAKPVGQGSVTDAGPVEQVAIRETKDEGTQDGIEERNKEKQGDAPVSTPPKKKDSQEEALKTKKLCYQCNGTRNDLRPGSTGCSACDSTGVFIAHSLHIHLLTCSLYCHNKD